MNVLLKKFRHDILTVIFFGVGLFVLLSLVSFNPLDPSFNSLGVSSKPLNYCGYAGSFLADLLFQTFGLGAYLISLWFMLLAKLSWDEELHSWKDPKWIGLGLLTINVSALMSTYFPDTRIFHNQVYLGGIVGLGLSSFLKKAFAFVGVQIILWATAAILVIFVTDKALKDLLPSGKYVNKALAAVGAYFKGISFFSKSQWKKGVAIRKEKPTPVSARMLESLKKDAKFVVKEDKNGQLNLPEELEEEETEDDLDDSLALEPKSTSGFDPKAGSEIPEFTKRRVVMKAKPPRKVANWVMPKISLLEDPPVSRVKIDKAEIQRKAESLVEKLRNFDIQGQIVGAKPGPLVTMYEFKPEADVKISNITKLEDDLSLALSSESVRVVGHIPGTDVVGIETANLKRETVYYKDLVAEDQFWSDEMDLPMAVGRAVDGKPNVVDLRKMPHLLIAGTTGSGKSVFVGSIITGLMFRHSPQTLRLVLIDPKMVDLAAFATVPHLILPHVTEPKKAAAALRWTVREMEKRYKSLSRFGVGKLELFNEKVKNLTKAEVEEHEAQNLAYEDGRQKNEMYYYQHLPYIVIVVDELADLMITEKNNIEEPIQRLTQKARACGIHLILATQSPRKDVVTGLIKTNIPGRVALKVASKMDSRIILDDSGAERLLPNGDMLFQAPGVGKPTRHHGPYLADKEISAIVQHWANQGEPDYDLQALKALEGPSAEGVDVDGNGGGNGMSDEDHDERYDEILAWASEQKDISASLIQRKFRLGYPRAARMIEVFEREGVVGPANGSKPRQVLVGSVKHL